ncbi:hypothetical protein JRQ81_016663 [Phrynocephalus forsythii]|uniref:Uncharacterized protein n=1 Tax=Phrynocephalus forsythii TaxID=171643 RepID=A0A9Q1B0T3_9SAUR|nr:hypothetical protein JRQ81_016663 [Phrynocephalus forsythii]
MKQKRGDLHTAEVKGNSSSIECYLWYLSVEQYAFRKNTWSPTTIMSPSTNLLILSCMESLLKTITGRYVFSAFVLAFRGHKSVSHW